MELIQQFLPRLIACPLSASPHESTGIDHTRACLFLRPAVVIWEAQTFSIVDSAIAFFQRRHSFAETRQKKWFSDNVLLVDNYVRKTPVIAPQSLRKSYLCPMWDIFQCEACHRPTRAHPLRPHIGNHLLFSSRSRIGIRSLLTSYSCSLLLSSNAK